MKKNGVTETVDFLHYYKTTYGIDIIHQDGPLIRGKAISDNMHYLKSPFYEVCLAILCFCGISRSYLTSCLVLQDAAKKLAEKANLSSTLSLIPEFVRIHPLPANMYIQVCIQVTLSICKLVFKCYYYSVEDVAIVYSPY